MQILMIAIIGGVAFFLFKGGAFAATPGKKASTSGKSKPTVSPSNPGMSTPPAITDVPAQNPVTPQDVPVRARTVSSVTDKFVDYVDQGKAPSVAQLGTVGKATISAPKKITTSIGSFLKKKF